MGAREKCSIDNGVGTDNRADGVGDVLLGWIGDKGKLPTENPSDQCRIYGAECHDHRTVDTHDVTRSP